MEKILITGASGFIGRRLAPLMVERYGSENVHCLSYSKESEHDYAGERILDEKGVVYRKIDLLDPESLAELPKGFTTIIHLAAMTDTDAKNFSANDRGTRNLFTALGVLDADVHVIYPGSSAVYAGRTDLSQPITLETPACPTNEYARSKLRAEEFLIELREKDGFRLTIARFNTVYGSVPRENSLLDVLKKHVISGSFVARLNWPGFSSIIHVDDICQRVLHLVMQPPLERYRLYLVSAESLTLADMYEPIFEILDKPYQRFNVPLWLWRALSLSLRGVRSLEWLLPRRIYNLLWRANLVAGNILEYEPNDAELKEGRADKTFRDAVRTIIAL